MKPMMLLLAIAALAGTTWAQAKPANPVVSAARDMLQRAERNLPEAAQEMPPDKYDYKPTPAQMSFGELVAHVTKSNDFLCAKLAGKSPSASPVSAKDGKDKLIAAMKASFDSCSAALNELQDAALAGQVTLRGEKPATKAAALIGLTNDWADHYAEAAMYLRLSGLLPPTAKNKQGE